MRVYTPRCVVCGNCGALDGVDQQGFYKWQAGENILSALPELDDDQRELLISGTHAHCWEVLWGGDDAA